MTLRLSAMAVALSLTTPSTVMACTCALSSTRWSDRAVVFIGNALEVRTSAKLPAQTVRFVTEASWRGPMPDTVTLRVMLNGLCAPYFAGGRYLVVADRNPSSRSELANTGCEDSWIIGYAGAKLAKLGAPKWVAPQMGHRKLDAHAVHLGESRKRPFWKFWEDSLVTGVAYDKEIASFEIADWVGQSGSIYLTPGLYQFRITWTDGTKYESYVSLRCEEPSSKPPCQVFRYFGNLRPRP